MIGSDPCRSPVSVSRGWTRYPAHGHHVAPSGGAQAELGVAGELAVDEEVAVQVPRDGGRLGPQGGRPRLPAVGRRTGRGQPVGERAQRLVVQRHGPRADHRASAMSGSAGCRESFQSPWP